MSAQSAYWLSGLPRPSTREDFDGLFDKLPPNRKYEIVYDPYYMRRTLYPEACKDLPPPRPMIIDVRTLDGPNNDLGSVASTPSSADPDWDMYTDTDAPGSEVWDSDTESSTLQLPGGQQCDVATSTASKDKPAVVEKAVQVDFTTVPLVVEVSTLSNMSWWDDAEDPDLSVPRRARKLVKNDER
ncbi:hypothetical protein CERSUDRAFT_72767 [Gelatoporia subvermispora B]|uniref:Uncharacterized protein n=1 Tax=Ceriporiopsis subvermispora (strain B) TaxID=914234 RepID=M2R105_CERS8|nr:hypothetical protein CERSUDRAFT_72767 [Gelatoporia subvermispora B]